MRVANGREKNHLRKTFLGGDGTKLLHDKKIGEGNRKNGNKYLSWAYVEAAQKARQSYPVIKRYYDKKAAQTNDIVAIKAVAHKLARASYYVLRDQAVFDEKRLFG